jgi:trehalose 2-sulfotransferase
VIACTPRTGSSLLCEALAATDVAGRPGEYIGSYKDGPFSQLETAIAETRSPNGVFGIKLHWHQFAYAVRDVYREPGQLTQASAVALLAEHLGTMKWVHLTRKDTAAQALSYFRAICSWVWRVKPDEEVDAAGMGDTFGLNGWAPPDPDLQQLAWLEDLMRDHDQLWQELYSSNGIEPLRVTYEDLDNQYEQTVSKVMNYLGLELPEGCLDGPRPLERQADDWSDRWLAVYRDRREQFRPQEPTHRWSNVDVLTRRPAVPRIATPLADVRLDDGGSGPTVRYACLIDTLDPVFEHEIWIWVLTQLHLARRQPSDLVVQAIEGKHRGHLAMLRDLGIDVVLIDRETPDDRCFSNLSQLFTSAVDADITVITSCDMAFAGDPSRLLPLDAIGAKVDHDGNPAYDFWLDVIECAGMDASRLALGRVPMGLRWTYANNLDGGLISVPKESAIKLRDRWPFWFDWTRGMVGSTREVNGRHVTFDSWFATYIDQISLGLAIADLGIECAVLPSEVNYSLRPPFAECESDPVVLRHYGSFSKEGLLPRTGVRNIDEAIDAVNEMLCGPGSQH